MEKITPGDVFRVNIKVVAGAKKERIEQSQNGLKVYVRAPAIEGKANKRLVEVLSIHFSVPKRCIDIVTGHACGNKIIQVSKK